MQRPIPRAETRAGLVLRLNTTDSVALLLLGEPGIGKSWCLSELSQTARGTIAFSVKCSMAARNIPLEPVDVLLRSLHDAGRLTSQWPGRGPSLGLLASANRTNFALISPEANGDGATILIRAAFPHIYRRRATRGCSQSDDSPSHRTLTSSKRASSRNTIPVHS